MRRQLLRLSGFAAMSRQWFPPEGLSACLIGERLDRSIIRHAMLVVAIRCGPAVLRTVPPPNQAGMVRSCSEALRAHLFWSGGRTRRATSG